MYLRRYDNVLTGDKQHLASREDPRAIEQAAAVRSETVSSYLRAAGIPVRDRGRPGVDPPNRPYLKTFC